MLKAINIKWDTDGDKKVFNDLPTEMIIPDNLEELYKDDKEYALEEISDWLSDETGFCHDGFELVIMKQYLVKVVETYEHTYLVDADSEEQAKDIVINNSDGCDSCGNDYCGADYIVREPNGTEDLSLYDICRETE